MKYALVFILVGLVAWFWRSQRINRNNSVKGAADGTAANKSAATGQLTKIVACQHCGLHLPLHEALAGRGGVYCCQAHKQSAGG